jgi:hypothetical protein
MPGYRSYYNDGNYPLPTIMEIGYIIKTLTRHFYTANAFTSGH